MEFEGQYLTYEEYKALGGTLDQALFNILEFESRKQIDLRTQNRLKGIEEIPQEVKLCMFRLVDRIDSYSNLMENTTQNGLISSENIDGYSVNYGSINQLSDVIKSKNDEIEDIIFNDLYGVIVNNIHIIYNGVI